MSAKKGRRRENPIIFNNKERHIKGRTSTVLQNWVAKEIRSGTMRRTGMHDFYQFNYRNLNLRQRGRGGELSDSTCGGLLSSEHVQLLKVIGRAGPERGRRVALISAPPGGRTVTSSRDWRGSFAVDWYSDQVRDFINFYGPTNSGWGEWSLNETSSYFSGVKC